MDNNSLKVSSGSVTDRGLSEKRPQNEDAFLDISDSGIYAVADGVGGAQAGDVASQMAMEILAEAFTNFPDGGDAKSVMKAAIERSNTAIFQMAYELPQLANMATTIVAVHLAGNVATIGHVGDSRLYRVDRSGNLYRETDDHSMVADEVRAGRMTEEQAENHPSRNVISRALGAEPTVDADLKTILVEPGTAFLICSDGITRHVGDQEIKGVLTFGGEPAEICEYLKDLCYQRGAEDNLTAVVIKIAAEAGSANGSGSPFSTISNEDDTVASARFTSDLIDDTDDPLLEIETSKLDPIAARRDTDDPDLDLTLSSDAETFSGSDVDYERTLPVVPVPAPAAAAQDQEVPQYTPDSNATTEDFSMLGNDGRTGYEERSSGAIGKAASMVGMLLVGSIIGLGAYHFFLVNPQPPAPAPAFTEMQSGNQQLSSFEDNRRTVDKMPAEAISRFGVDPRDAEDYFLLGRAQMLLGQYSDAKGSFTTSRNRMAAGDVDPNNKRTIETEIAIATAVLNDSTVQGIFRSQLELSNTLPASNTATP